jgi:hypothetical protein
VAKIGTEQNPAIVRVRTAERAEEIFALCQEHGVRVIVGIEPDKREDISDIERTLQRPVPRAVRRSTATIRALVAPGKDTRGAAAASVPPDGE